MQIYFEPYGNLRHPKGEEGKGGGRAQSCSLYKVAGFVTRTGACRFSRARTLGKEKSLAYKRSHFSEPYGFVAFPVRCHTQRKKTGLYPVFFVGDPYGTRTHVTTVKGWCLNRLTNGPSCARFALIL